MQEGSRLGEDHEIRFSVDDTHTHSPPSDEAGDGFMQAG